MRKVFIFSLVLSLFCGCKKERGGRIDIYLLKSFTTTINQLTNPATVVVSDAVLADVPLWQMTILTFI